MGTMRIDNVPTLSLRPARTVSVQRRGSRQLHHIEPVSPLMLAQQNPQQTQYPSSSGLGQVYLEALEPA
jgi:hypothetical protein